MLFYKHHFYKQYQAEIWNERIAELLNESLALWKAKLTLLSIYNPLHPCMGCYPLPFLQQNFDSPFFDFSKILTPYE